MFSKKNIYYLLIFIALSVFTLTTIQPVRKCTQCGHPIYIEKDSGELVVFRESLLSMMFSPNSSFMHFICVRDYLRDNPLERDNEGRIIPKQ